MNIFYFPILKTVARSFYLTICLLPKKLQEPIALAYLLARASDTLADRDLPSYTRADDDLIRLIPSLFKEFNHPSRDPLEKDAIHLVWQRILEGQECDLQKFSSQSSPVILSREELSRYLYLVAGSVGEFWTTLAAHHLPCFARAPLPSMREWGIDYGKGLQLTNILRDRHEDAAHGRFYCHEDHVEQLHEEALYYLSQGRCYIDGLRPGRFKMASALPLMLAVKTLSLLAKNPQASNVKVSRGMVYLSLLRSSIFLFR